jgi:hypothetical protein
MPAMAIASAIDPAPLIPACSNNGAKASPVAGPPVSVTDPASTPNSGGRSNSTATATPSAFWATAKNVAITSSSTTCGPPVRNSDTLALSPMLVKNAIINGLCKVVSNRSSVAPCACATRTPSATNRPPMIGGGRL